MKMSRQLHALTVLPPGKEFAVPIGGCVGPRAGLYNVNNKISFSPAENRNPAI
jgi:hypothetical protein